MLSPPLDYAVRSARLPGPVGRLLLSPVGWPLHVASLLIAIATVVIWSGPAPSLWPAIYAGYMAAGVAVTWFLRLLSRWVAAQHFGVRLAGPARPWLVTPAVFVLTFWLVWFGVPSAVRFRLSRPALERAARAALAHPGTPSAPARIGLYGTCVPRVIGTSVYFTVGGRGLWDEDYGYAYRPAGRPRSPLRFSYLNDDAYCRPIGGTWYEWCGGYSPRPGPVPAWSAR
jgi:hypothetical protein